jgi:hypothetical protein
MPIINATPNVNPCIVFAGINIRNLSSLSRPETIIIAPTAKARTARLSDPCRNAYVARIPESAPVGPTMLNLLPPKTAAKRPAQMAVMIPATGDAPAAIPREMESGIDTNDTVNPDLQLNLNWSVNFFMKKLLYIFFLFISITFYEECKYRY